MERPVYQLDDQPEYTEEIEQLLDEDLVKAEDSFFQKLLLRIFNNIKAVRRQTEEAIEKGAGGTEVLPEKNGGTGKTNLQDVTVGNVVGTGSAQVGNLLVGGGSAAGNSCSIGASSTNENSLGIGSASAYTYGMAVGEGVEARNGSLSIGKNSTAQMYSIAVGEGCLAYNSSTATGSGCRGNGNYSTAHGLNTTAQGPNSLTAGENTVAEGQNSFTGGYQTRAAGENSFATGKGTLAEGQNAAAFGEDSEATGENSFAAGKGAKSIGEISFAMGEEVLAQGTTSFAFGTASQALANNSYAFGTGAVAYNKGQLALGFWNEDRFQGDEDLVESLFVVGAGTGEEDRRNAFEIYQDGQVNAGSINTVGADYAEYFEWADGNPDGEDRVGRFVTLTGKKIRVAGPGDDFILGVVSAAPCVVGNASEEQWHGMEQRDAFGRLLLEYREFEEQRDEDGKLISSAMKGNFPKLSPDYDPKKKFVPRSQRPEWDAVGVLGQLVVFDGGACEPDGLCACGENGTAVPADKGYLVLERVDADKVRIWVK